MKGSNIMKKLFLYILLPVLACILILSGYLLYQRYLTDYSFSLKNSTKENYTYKLGVHSSVDKFNFSKHVKVTGYTY